MLIAKVDEALVRTDDTGLAMLVDGEPIIKLDGDFGMALMAVTKS